MRALESTSAVPLPAAGRPRVRAPRRTPDGHSRRRHPGGAPARPGRRGGGAAGSVPQRFADHIQSAGVQGCFHWDLAVDDLTAAVARAVDRGARVVVRASPAQRPGTRFAYVADISSTAGRVARPGTAVCNLTEFGVNGLTEALRQEVGPKRVRVSVVGPGTVDTELGTHLRDGVGQAIERQIEGMELLRPLDIRRRVLRRHP
ncbi:SDR family NAD(P)-dependent oxidoreductase [Streptomyces sp. NPDC004457]